MGWRSSLMVVAALAVAAPSVAAGRGCEALLGEYARVAERFPEWRSNAEGVDRNTSRAAQRVLQAGCVTRLNDLAGLAALEATLSGSLRREYGAVIFPTWLQAGVVPGLLAEQRARDFFAALGMNSRGVGAAGLGRWVLVGPFRTEGGLAEAAAAARSAGFIAPVPRAFP